MDSEPLSHGFQDRDRALPRNRGKVLEEVFLRRSSLEVVEQVLHRYTRACEAKSSTHHFMIATDKLGTITTSDGRVYSRGCADA
jgi:hypothetical protein